MLGTIGRRFGHEDALAVDARLYDGQLELFWASGLEKTSDALGA